MSNRFNHRKFVIFLSEQGVELRMSEYINTSIRNLICYCDHPQSALRIASDIAKNQNLTLINRAI